MERHARSQGQTKPDHEEPIRFSRISDLLASAIADALNHPLQGTGDLTLQLFNYLRQKEILLILDNFQYWIEGADLLANLL